MSILIIGRFYKKTDPDKEAGFIIRTDGEEISIEEYARGEWLKGKKIKLKKEIQRGVKEEMFVQIMKYLRQKGNIEGLLVNRETMAELDPLERAYLRETLKAVIKNNEALKEIAQEAVGEVLSELIDERLNRVARKLIDMGKIDSFSLEEAKKTLKYKELTQKLVEQFKNRAGEFYDSMLQALAHTVWEKVNNEKVDTNLIIPIKAIVKDSKSELKEEALMFSLANINHLKENNKLNLKIHNREIEEIFEELYEQNFETILGVKEEKLARAYAKIDKAIKIEGGKGEKTDNSEKEIKIKVDENEALTAFQVRKTNKPKP